MSGNVIMAGGVGTSPAMLTGRRYRVPNCTLATSGALGNGTLRAVPKYIPNGLALTLIGAEVTIVGEAGSKVRLGIYANTPNDFRPGALQIDAGQIAGDSAIAQEIGCVTTLAPGWWWFAAAVQSAPTTQPTLRTIGTPAESIPVDYLSVILGAGSLALGCQVTGVAAALPGTFGAPAIATAAAALWVAT